MSFEAAVDDFRRARRQAAMEQIMARLAGRSADLLLYDEVRAKLKARTGEWLGLQDIPLDAIVGSVGRYADFTRSFFPKQDSDQQRWARVQRAVNELEGVPPIKVYQIGEVYFVQDGNHRVSVARQLGAPTIQAYVTKIHTKVSLTPDIEPDDLILKAEYTEFLERTELDRIRPEADLGVTVPGQYDKLLEHIAVHRHFMGLDQEREIPHDEAVAHWYDEVYLPVARVIRERGILRDFPGRTETDLYLWASEHRTALVEALDWEIDTTMAAADLAAEASPKPHRVVARIGSRILDAVTPDELENGPRAGHWREERLAARQEDRLFADILVAVSGEERGWHALDQALEIARYEGARVFGLHVVLSEEQMGEMAVQALRQEFDRRCSRQEIPGKLAIEVGKVARTITDRARWTDLVVLNLAHPPGSRLADRLSSGFRTLLLRSPRPVLAVPGSVSPLRRTLLAYDGSPKAKEALFVATYLAERWTTPVVVVSVPESRHDADKAIREAQDYLKRGDAEATFVQARGPAGDAILRTAADHGCDLILMGGYGHSPVVEVIVGSTVDQVLRESQCPILVCR